MAANNLAHTYLFEAYYIDDTQYMQGADDVSCRDPQRSAFYDICPANGEKPIKDVPLWAFAIRCRPDHEPGDGVPRAVAVDFRNGAFEVDGMVFFLHEPLETGPLSDFQPIYYRRTNQHRHTRSNGSGAGHTSEIAGYSIGFKAKTARGKKVERIFHIIFPAGS